MSAILHACIRCQWRMRNFRARSDSWCSKHEMIVHDTLGTFCHELEHPEHPELAAETAALARNRPGIYVWLLYFREPDPSSDELPYYHESAFLCDVESYRTQNTSAVLKAQQELHAREKAVRAARNLTE